MTRRTDFVSETFELDHALVRYDGNGSLVVPARLTRTGFFLYPTFNDAHSYELRPDAEVFAHDSIETAEGLPVIIGHVDAVTRENLDDVAIGYVRRVHRDDIYLAGELVIHDSSAIQRVLSGELVEVSMGYEVQLDTQSRPNEYNGTKLEAPARVTATQRRIRYNHAGLGSRGWGRAGSSVAIAG